MALPGVQREEMKVMGVWQELPKPGDRVRLAWADATGGRSKEGLVVAVVQLDDERTARSR